MIVLHNGNANIDDIITEKMLEASDSSFHDGSSLLLVDTDHDLTNNGAKHHNKNTNTTNNDKKNRAGDVNYNREHQEHDVQEIIFDVDESSGTGHCSEEGDVPTPNTHRDRTSTGPSTSTNNMNDTSHSHATEVNTTQHTASDPFSTSPLPQDSPQAMIRQDDRAIQILRGIMVLVLLLASMGTTLFVYYFARQSEQQNFNTEYQSISNFIVGVLLDDLTNFVWAVRAVGSSWHLPSNHKTLHPGP
jgi:hypothetical protein